jgi:dienelactone hydrolase
MSILTRAIEHTHDGQIFESLLVLNGEEPQRRPAVLVFHAWEGRSKGQEKFATRLTEWGYAGLAVDLYGKGRHGNTPAECQALMTPLMQDRALLRSRVLKIMDVVAEAPEIDAANVAAIGFCFGGLCALDLARAGGNVKGVASFHGLFTPPGLPIANPIHPKIIAFHGWDDPMGPPEQALAFTKEFTEAGADWQLHAFSATKHGFMNEEANLPEMGIIYNERSARRGWNDLELFLAEALGVTR